MSGLSNRLIFLNHSSLVVEGGATRILCDPWFKGSAFNNGWRLLVEGSHEINEIEFDYVWISHEHPDHFSIPTLLDIKDRKRFLYQKTSDKKVKNWLEQKQHLVTELEDGKEYKFNGVNLTSFVSDGYDSAALFSFPNGDQFLNLNDARVELGTTISKIRDNLTNLRLVSIQFSYANWAGNEGDDDIPFHQQDLVIERILKINEELKPEGVLLFASYIFCSHEENFYWNKRFWLDYVVEKLVERGVTVIIPVPNQALEIGEVARCELFEQNKLAIEFWKKKTEEVKVKDYVKTGIGIDEIVSAYAEWFEKLWEENSLESVLNAKNKDFNILVKINEKIAFLSYRFLKNPSDISRRGRGYTTARYRVRH